MTIKQTHELMTINESIFNQKTFTHLQYKEIKIMSDSINFFIDINNETRIKKEVISLNNYLTKV